MQRLTRSNPLTEWLAALIEAAPLDRRMVSIEGCDAGLTFERVRCVRHDADLNWLSAFSHMDRTEGSYRLQHGADARLHQPGDLVPAADPRKTDTCRFCDAPVIWAATASGKSMPVDAEPNPAGNVVLVVHPEPGERPLAVVLHTEFERASTSPDSIHTSHMKTCSADSKKASATKPTGGRR